MIKHRAIPMALMLLALGAQAQGTDRGVTESTDPARAAAVEEAARQMERRRSQQVGSGDIAPSAYVVKDRTEAGVEFLSGGITVGDRVAMQAQRKRYSLWVTTVAKGSGAYLTNARLLIVNLQQQRVVLDRIADGPWFMLALPSGHYEISATLQDDDAATPQTLTQRVKVSANGTRQAVLRFDSLAKVSPEMHSPTSGNPLGRPVKAH